MTDSELQVPLLSVRGLTRRFGGVVAVRDLDFDVHDGEVLAVIGPNGAGKSTLFKMLAGQDRPSAGTVELRGVGQVQGRTPRHLVHHGVALARQVPRPLGSLTVAQNVEVGLRAGAQRIPGRVSADERLAEILELTALASRANVQAGRLALLDLKRLEVARALAGNPDLLLLDEVSAGLNESELESAIEMLRTLNGRGITLIIVEHVQRVVHELADRVMVLNWGRHLMTGTAAEVTADERVQEIYLGSGRADERTAAAPLAPATTAAVRAAGSASARDDGLEIRSLAVRRGGQLAVRDLDLEIAPGQIVTVVGANGAGKTTLAQSISGLVSPASGEIRWRGQDITRVAPERRSRLGIAHCQEGRKLFPGLTVEENLHLGAFGVKRGERERRAEQVYEMFPVLAERRAQEAVTMSGGQQQMLAIGRALMSEPGLLLLDEVTLGLSPKVADEIYAAIGRVAQSGTSLLLVEQDIGRSMAVASRVIVLSQGSAAFDGAPAELSRELIVDAYLGG